jgi:alkylation response protein AidB-like acyl-CoA dehydrogenase
VTKVRDSLATYPALGPPDGIGLSLAAPILAEFGTRQQVARFLPAILRGEDAWCQLFSEPDAGSDLAALTTRGEPDGRGWRLTGRKVWTSMAHLADWGLLLARTDRNSRRHEGITLFALPMNQPGIEIRPLREMTGEAVFNEVFLDDAWVPAGGVIGSLGSGWRIALKLLSEERSSLATAGGPGAFRALPGTRAGYLDRAAGEVLQASDPRPGRAVDHRTFRSLCDLASALGRRDDPDIRQGLARMWTTLELTRLSSERAKSGNAVKGEGNIAKLLLSQLFRDVRDVGNGISGSWGLLIGPQTPGRGLVQDITLYSPAPAIYGGTDQIQRNILAERVLGLPKETHLDQT